MFGFSHRIQTGVFMGIFCLAVSTTSLAGTKVYVGRKISSGQHVSMQRLRDAGRPGSL